MYGTIKRSVPSKEGLKYWIMENQDTTYWDKIDAYLIGQLNKEALAEFELKLRNDPQLAEDVATQRALLAGLEAYKDKEDFYKILDKIDAEEAASGMQAESTPSAKPLQVASRRWRRPAYAIAASVAVLLVAIWWVLTPRTNYSELADQSFVWSGDLVSDQLSGSGLVGSNDEEDIEALKVLVGQLDDVNIDSATESLRSLRGSFADESYAAIVTDFYLAQIRLRQGNSEEAIRLLQPLSEKEGIPLMPHIHYYLALAQLQEGQVEEARRHLVQIPNDTDLSAKKQTLLEAID